MTRLRPWMLLAVCALLAACAGVSRNALPADQHLQATVLGGTDYRYWGDDEIRRIDEITEAELEEQYAGFLHKEHTYLALSGGGAYGAYGAGVLKGWTALETRPEFTMVTGISTGALIAPFAFLGSDYDDELELLYTTSDTTRIARTRNLSQIVRGDALADTTPLAEVLESFVTDEMVEAIGREYAKGRSLIIGTTNLDAQRPVIWNVTRIAASGKPGAADLIRKILRASAAIPGAFPPVYIDVQTPEGTFDEMHVDGGATFQMFLYPAQTDFGGLLQRMDARSPKAYLIRNSMPVAEYDPVDPRLMPIAMRTIDSLIRTQGIGDFYRIYSQSQRDGIDIRITWIPGDAVEGKPQEAFDPVFMKALFDYGYQRTLAGETWSHVNEQLEFD